MKYRLLNTSGAYELRDYDGVLKIYHTHPLPEEEGGEDSTFMGFINYESSFEVAVDNLEEEMRILCASWRRECGAQGLKAGLEIGEQVSSIESPEDALLSMFS